VRRSFSISGSREKNGTLTRSKICRSTPAEINPSDPHADGSGRPLARTTSRPKTKSRARTEPKPTFGRITLRCDARHPDVDTSHAHGHRPANKKKMLLTTTAHQVPATVSSGNRQSHEYYIAVPTLDKTVSPISEPQRSQGRPRSKQEPEAER